LLFLNENNDTKNAQVYLEAYVVIEHGVVFYDVSTPLSKVQVDRKYRRLKAILPV